MHMCVCVCSLSAETEAASQHEGIGGIPQGAQSFAPPSTVHTLQLRFNVRTCFTHRRVHQITNLNQVM